MGPERVLRIMDIQNRYMKAILRAMPGVATPALIPEFEEIIRDLDGLISEGSVPGPGLSLQELQALRVDSIEYIARVHESLRQVPQAVEGFEKAAQEYEKIGLKDRADASRRKKEENLQSQRGVGSADIRKLKAELKKAPKESLEHIDVLIRLGECSGMAGDDFEAIEYLKQAETLLEEGGYRNPTDGDLGANLGNLLASIQNPEANSPSDPPLMRSMALRAIYKRLYHAFVQSSRKINPGQAKEYEAKFAAMDRPEPHPDLMKEMLKLMRPGNP